MRLKFISQKEDGMHIRAYSFESFLSKKFSFIKQNFFQKPVRVALRYIFVSSNARHV